MPDSNIRLFLCLKTDRKGNTDQKEIFTESGCTGRTVWRQLWITENKVQINIKIRKLKIKNRATRLPAAQPQSLYHREHPKALPPGRHRPEHRPKHSRKPGRKIAPKHNLKCALKFALKPDPKHAVKRSRQIKIHPMQSGKEGGKESGKPFSSYSCSA